MMTQLKWSLSLVFGLILAIGAAGSDEEGPAFELPDLSVFSRSWPDAATTSAQGGLGLQLTSGNLERGATLAEALAETPGIHMQRRGAQTFEPNIRGFASDRIATQFNGLPLLNAAPTQTAAPVNFFGPSMVGLVRIDRSLPSVTEGPATTGGRLRIEMFEALPEGGPDSMDGALNLRHEGNRNGRQADGFVRGHANNVSYRTGGHYARLGDYTSGDGRRVDADYEGRGGGIALQATLDGAHAVEGTVQHFRQDLVRNGSLPLDTRDTDLTMGTLGYRWAGERARWRFRAGYAETDPFLTSVDRLISAASPVEFVEAHGRARSHALGGAWEYQWAPAFLTIVGVDATWQTRDAERERRLRNGNRFHDRIWPDVHGRDIGVFGELRTWVKDDLRLRLGARIDAVRTEARRADALVEGIPGARGSTVRENYIAFNGTAAGDTRQDDVGGAANLVLEKDLSPALTARFGVGLTAAVPGASERYRAFLNALGGGVEVGNPALDPEINREVQAGVHWKVGDLEVEGEVFFSSVDDYIHRRIIEPTPTIYGYRNIDADFYGGEIAVRWTPRRWISGLSFPASYAAVEGRDRSGGGRLPEIPPWELRVAAHYERTVRSTPLWGELEARLAGAKNNPKPEELPIFRDTGGYTVCALRVGAQLTHQLSLELAVENLFDRAYYDYLQLPVAEGAIGPSDGSLAPGEAIPGIGRSVDVSMRWRF